MKFAIVGTNYMSDIFIDTLKDVEGGTVSAIISRSIDKARNFAEKYNIDNYFDNYEDAVDSKNFDAVYIATPNSTHKEIARFFLENRIPVILEKPFCVNEFEAKELFDLSKENKTFILDAIVPLYTDNYLNIKKNLHLVGKLHRIDLTYSQYTKTWDIYLEDKSKTAYNLQNATGALMAIGIYNVAFLEGLFGKAKDIKAIGTFQDNGVDHEVSALFKYDDYEATMHCARGVVSNNINSIAGEKGNIYFSTINRIEKVWFEDRLSKEIVDLTVNDKLPMAYEIQEFIDCINENRYESDLLSHELSLDILKTMSKIRKEINLKYPNE